MSPTISLGISGVPSFGPQATTAFGLLSVGGRPHLCIGPPLSLLHGSESSVKFSWVAFTHWGTPGPQLLHQGLDSSARGGGSRTLSFR